MADRWTNPFAKVRRLDPDSPADRSLILRYVRHREPDPLDAESLALGICESIRDGDMTLTIEDDLLILRAADGEADTVAINDHC